jgi:C4-type Zn-finger protein
MKVNIYVCPGCDGDVRVQREIKATVYAGDGSLFVDHVHCETCGHPIVDSDYARTEEE